jgi:hypothetical protein
MNPITAVVATLTISVSVTAAAYAQGTTRLVATTGVDVGDCSVAACATIQFAANAAAEGDAILVAAGHYAGSVLIGTNRLTLRGAGAAVTTINGGVIAFIRTNDPITSLTVEGFTIDSGGMDNGVSLSAIVTFGPVDWVVRGNIIRGNQTGISLGSGGLPGALIENNVIASNANFGIHNDRTPQVVIRNNTIAANGLVGYREQYGPPVNSVFVNNIVAFNGTAMTNAIHPAGFEAASPNYFIAFNNLFGNANGDTYGDYGGTCCPPVPYLPSPGTGEISVDPMFRDPANGDYRLSPGSPSIDAGTNGNAPATDLDGHVRPIDGDGDGTAVVDMGAFESEPETDPTPPFVSAAAEAQVPASGDPRVPVIVWGLVRDESGVNLTSGTFAVTDEYGQVEPQGTFSIKQDGRYSFVVWLEVARADDRNGRQFLITVTGEDDDGHVGIASTTVAIRRGR